MKRFLLFIFLCFYTICLWAQSSLVINEVMYNPSGNLQSTFEWIELYNLSSKDTLDVQGFYLRTDLNNSINNPVWGDDEIVAWETRNPGTIPYDLISNKYPLVINSTKIPPGKLAVILDPTHNYYGYAYCDFPDSAIILTIKNFANFGSDQMNNQVNGLLYNSEEVIMIYNGNPANTQSILLDSMSWKDNVQTVNFSLQRDNDCIFRFHSAAAYKNTGGYDKDTDNSLLLQYSPGLQNYDEVIPFMISPDTLCDGSTFDFSIQLCGPHKVSWNFGDPLSGSANIDSSADNVQHAFSQSGNYTVTATIIYGSYQGSVSNSIFVVPLPEYDLGNDTAICLENSIDLIANNGVSYLWNDKTSDSVLTVQLAGTYYVDVQNEFGCQQSDTIQIDNYSPPIVSLGNDTSICYNSELILTPFGFKFYLWSDNSTNPNLNINSKGIYFVEITDQNGCKASDTIQVDEYPATILELGDDSSFCSGSTITINANSGFSTYTWSNGYIGNTLVVDTSGTYILTAIDTNACTSMDSISIEEIPIPVVSFAANNICEGESISFSNFSDKGTYEWSFGDNTFSTAFNPQHEYLQAGTYSVMLMVEKNSCLDSLQTTITVYAKPEIGFYTDVVSGCLPLEINFTDTTSNSYAYKWNFGDGKFSTKLNPSHTYKDSGLYSVSLTVISIDGCKAELSKEELIEVYPLPKAGFEMDKSELNITDSDVSFKNMASGATTFYWYFSDGTVIIDNTPLHTFMDTGLYKIKQVVENQYGCKDSIEKSLKVFRDYEFFMPSVFTPNHDGLNDILYPKGIGLKLYEYSFEIYNRWGELLFISHNPKEGWNGMVKNRKAEDGAYSWKIILTDNKENSSKTYTGLVSLLK